MKNMSMFQVILLAMFGALGISGILIFALVVGTGKGNAVGPVVVWGTLDQAAFTTVLRQIAEDDTRLAQVSYVQKDAATYEDDLREALASGSGPDLFLLRQDYVVRDAAKVIPIPYSFLSESQFQNIFVDAARPYLASGGVLGIPLIVDPMLMYWNRDMFSNAGYAQPPQKWAELPEMAEKIVKKDDSGSILKAAVALGEYANVDHAKALVSLLIMQAGGGITQKDSTGRLVPVLGARAAGAKSQATESALRFYTEFADPSKLHYSWNRALPSSRAAFASGDLALYFGYASEARGMSRTNPNLNFAAAPVPQGDGTSTDINVARVYALSVSRNAKNPQGAMTVATLLGDSPFSRALSFTLDVPAARRDVLQARDPEENAVFEREALIARSWIDPDPEKTDGIFRSMIEGITSGSSRLSETIGRADQQLAQIIGQ